MLKVINISIIHSYSYSIIKAGRTRPGSARSSPQAGTLCRAVAVIIEVARLF